MKELITLWESFLLILYPVPAGSTVAEAQDYLEHVALMAVLEAEENFNRMELPDALEFVRNRLVAVGGA